MSPTPVGEVPTTPSPSAQKRRWDRKNSCPFCHSLLSNFVRHLQRQHPDEREVRELLAISHPRDPARQRRERALFAATIRARGNEAYNTGRTEGLLSARRPRGGRPGRKSEELRQCPNCRNFYSRASYRKHKTKCVRGASPTSRGTDVAVVVEAQRPLEPNAAPVTGASRALQSQLRRRDEIREAGLADPFIVHLAEDYTRSHEGKRQLGGASHRLRDAARLLLAVRRADPRVANFEDCLRPRNFEAVAAAARSLAGVNESTGDVSVVGMSDRLLAILRDAVALRLDTALLDRSVGEEERNTIRQDTEDYGHLLTHRWGGVIGHISHATEVRRWCESVSNRVPEDEDVEALYRRVGELQLLYAERLVETPSRENYERLAEATIVDLTVYNRRRAPEVAMARLAAWRERTSSSSAETPGTSSSAAQQSLERFYVTGKCGRPVPVIVPERVLPSVDLLVRTRSSILDEACSGSELLFPRPGSAEPYDTTSIVRRLRMTLPLRRPELVTTTGLRRHLATKVAENEGGATKGLLSQMGHSRPTHLRHYVSPLLSAAATQRVADQLQRATTANPSDAPRTRRPNKFTVSGAAAAPAVIQPVRPLMGEPNIRLPSRPIRRNAAVRRWTEAETIAAVQLFPGHVREGRVPSREEVERAVRDGRGVPGRSAESIRMRIWGLVRGREEEAG